MITELINVLMMTIAIMFITNIKYIPSLHCMFNCLVYCLEKIY